MATIHLTPTRTITARNTVRVYRIVYLVLWAAFWGLAATTFTAAIVYAAVPSLDAADTATTTGLAAITLLFVISGVAALDLHMERAR